MPNRKRLFQFVSSILISALVASLIWNYAYTAKIQRENQYANVMFQQFAVSVEQAAFLVGYHNSSPRDYRQASVDMGAAASELEALTQYQSTVRGRGYGSGVMPSKMGQDANYLYLVALSLVNDSPRYRNQAGGVFRLTRQAATRSAYRVVAVVINMERSSSEVFTDRQMNIAAHTIYHQIPPIVRSHHALGILEWWDG